MAATATAMSLERARASWNSRTTASTSALRCGKVRATAVAARAAAEWREGTSEGVVAGVGGGLLARPRQTPGYCCRSADRLLPMSVASGCSSDCSSCTKQGECAARALRAGLDDLGSLSDVAEMLGLS